MIAQLIWIITIYASAAALVHILHHREKTRRSEWTGKRLQYILITRNHESVVEWYIRILAVHAFLIGRPLYVTVMDDGSEDGTMAVASRMASHGSPIELAPAMALYGSQSQSEYRQGIMVDLRMQEQPLPLRIMQLPGSRGYRSKRGE